MATIIKFPPVPAAHSRQKGNESAKIILFPGIRYERLTEHPAKKPRAARRRKKA